MDIFNQKFLVLGMSKSGFSACKFILENNKNLMFYEENSNEKIDKNIEEILSLGGTRVFKENVEETVDNVDVVIISPGVPINHHVAVYAKRANKKIIGELELGITSFTPPIVGVTGTNGKTTTVSLINEIIKRSGKESLLCGNVGIPVTSVKNEVNKGTVLVTEVSSFQLESVSGFCPHISCVLNISPDHLERHYTMENYVFLKKRIFKNQTKSEYTLLNYDDETVRSFEKDCNSNVLFVSTKIKTNGAYMVDGKIYYDNEYVLDRESVSLMGEHNTYNILFAVAVAKLLNIGSYDIEKALTDFKGVKHRLEKVDEKNGVLYVNDSKATNTASTIGALKTLDRPTVLILGGSEKGEDYTELFKEISASPVKKVVVYGNARKNMLLCASNNDFLKIYSVDSFDEGVQLASSLATKGDEVLLSPACASFDSFVSFEERGEEFIKLVGEIN